MTYLINIILLFIWIIVTIALCFTGIGIEDLEEKKKLEDAITDLRFAIAVLKNGY